MPRPVKLNVKIPKTDTLLVRATHPDRPCPMLRTEIKMDKTGKNLTLIYHDKPKEVPNHHFYRKRLKMGDLLLVEAKPAARRGGRKE